MRKCHGNDHKNTMSTSSAAAQIIADSIEEGFSELQAVAIANKNLQGNRETSVARSQIRGAMHRMTPVKSAVKKAK